MVVADKKMAVYHGDSLYHYILTLMSIVRTLLLLLLLLLLLWEHYYYYYCEILLLLLLLLLLIFLLILWYPNKGECVCGEERNYYIQSIHRVLQ
jgi:hypothetical protein